MPMDTLEIVKLTTKRGFTLNAFKNDAITLEIQSKGEYDANTLDSIIDILSMIKPNLSLDVGANIGNHALVIAKLSKKLIAFEPVGFVYKVLQSNFIENEITNAQAINYGLSNQKITREIFIPENGNLGSSSLEAKDGQGQLVKIATVIGDDYIKEHCDNLNVDFIKMDVEGHEPAALQGLKATIYNCQPLLLLEWKSPETISAFSQHKLFSELFPEYSFYSLSYTSNKKVYSKGIKGFFKRLYCRFFAKRWCLSTFESSSYYSNVYFVPSRYKSVFDGLKYLERSI